MKKRLLAASIAAYATLAYADLWMDEGFEDASPGDSLMDVEGFTAAQQSVITRLGAYDGEQSAVSFISRGDDGWSRWGYEITLPAGLTQGSEIWWQQAQYIPDDFDWGTDTGSLKWFRVCRLELGNNRGCVDTQIKGNGGWRTIVEHAGDYWDQWPSIVKAQKGRWEVWQHYVKLHSTDGIVRMWKDGVPVGELRRETMGSPIEVSHRVLMSTYWNGGAPKSQTVSLDNVQIALKGGGRDDTGSLTRDTNGNLMIPLSDAPVEPPPVDCPECPEPINPRTIIIIEDDVKVLSDLPVHEVQ